MSDNNFNDDDLKKLADALRAAPAPDAARKEAALRMAEENFARVQDNLQETDPAMRPSQQPTKPVGMLKGLAMNFSNNLRPALLATSSLVVVGIGVLVVQNSAPTGPVIEPVVLEQELSRTASASTKAVQAETAIEVEEDAATLGIAEPMAEAEAPAALAEDRAQLTTNAKPSATLRRLSTGQAQTAPRTRGLGAVAGGVNDTIAPQALITPAPPPDVLPRAQAEQRDRFAQTDIASVKITSEEPVSTFSIDVDTASYAWVRRALESGQMPNPDAVRIEEMVNYFSYDYPAPEGDAPFATQVRVTQTPWNADTQLVEIGIQGALPAVEDRPPLNLVFLIDTSGSMQSADKLPLLIQSIRLMLPELRESDQVAIVTYAGSAGVALEPTPAGDRAAIERALRGLTAGGSTAGAAGLERAYALAEEMAEDGDVSRVLLATDGDFNVGLSGVDEMTRFIEAKRGSGTYLSVLGFGRGNLNDALMQSLAQNGNGQAAYIDTLSEARKVLVDQLSGALYPIAQDVKIQMEFNPAVVAEYRLIGYETRALAREDFNNDRVDAGEIGAGHQVTALYEVTPVGSPAVRNDALRYGGAVAASDARDELGFLRLRYKAPGEATSQLIETPISATDAPGAAGFAAAIAGFGQLLQNGAYIGSWSFGDAIASATETRGADRFGYRNEAIALMRLAESLSK